MSNEIKSILINDHNAVFTVLSKNACTSMKAHLVNILGIPKTVIFPKDVHEPKVYDYKYLDDEELVSTYHSHLRFCIIRNPWSRLVSCFKDKIRDENFVNPLYENGVHVRLLRINNKFRSGMSFEEFVDIVCEIPDSKADTHFRSQFFDIATLTNQLRVNYIAKLELLEPHFEEINQLSGMQFDDFPRLNHTKKQKNYTEYYTPKLIEKVRDRYSGDIELFNYSFEEKDEFESGIIDESRESKLLASPYLTEILEEKKKALDIKKAKSLSNKSPKIFCIGLNKTGTRSLNAALNILKLKAAHHNSPHGRIGEILKYNVETNKPILSSLEGYKAYSDWIDMEGTNNSFFKIMDQQYPGSKFIFTDRNVEDWIGSRIKHVKKFDGLETYQKAYPKSDWYHMNTDAWRAEYQSHKDDVLNYFKDRKNDLLLFNMFEGDGWKELCSFLQIPIPKKDFPSRGKSSYTKKTFIKLNFLRGNIFIKNRNAIFYFLPGPCNLSIKASLISYFEKRRKFEFPNIFHLVNDFPFPSFNKKKSNPSFREQFKFTIVRNPWDRLVDCYQQIICSNDLPARYFEVGAEESFNEYDNLFRRHMNFEEFVKKVCLIPQSKANRFYGSQIYQLTTTTGELLVNYIGYYENLKQAATDIFEKTRISLHEIPRSQEKINDTSYTQFYTEELQEMVQNKFADDIDLFGYRFGVPLENQVVDFVTEEFVTRYTSSKCYVDFLKEKNKHLNQQLISTNRELNSFKERLSRIEIEIGKKGIGGKSSNPNKELEKIQNSLSWKITAPARYVGGLLNKFSFKK